MGVTGGNASAGQVSVKPDGSPSTGVVRAGWRLFAAVLVVGIGTTSVLGVVVLRTDRTTNDRLLKLQTSLTSQAVAAAVPLSVEDNLASAARLSAAASGDIGDFVQAMRTSVTRKGPFQTAWLWQGSPAAAAPRVAARIGAPGLLAAGSGSALALYRQALAAKTFAVRQIVTRRAVGLDCAIAAHGPRGIFVAYGEIVLPVARRAPAAHGSPTANLNFALYLGRHQTPASLLIASAGTPLPLRGDTASAAIPFGNTALTLVASARTPLAGRLAEALSWVIFIGGPLVTLAALWVTWRLVRGRVGAERLSAEVGRLYLEQRSVAETLQRAILPRQMPAVPGMEIAGLYQPGVAGVDVGGDWYDVVPLDDGRFAFVVGDVSGRGLRAAAVMASLHYSSRAYALEGHAPAEVLERLARTLSLEKDGHMATVLCGLVDVGAHQVTLASAGHLPPLVCGNGEATVVSVRPGVPIGVPARAASATATVMTGAGGTLLAYTDGLVERRGESLDTGMARLREAAARGSESLDKMLSGLVTELTEDSPSDDIALIGLRWLN